MNEKSEFEKLVDSLSKVEERITLCKGQIKELDTQIKDLLEEMKVETVEEAKEKIGKLTLKITEVEKEVIEEARKVGILE